MNNIKSKSSWDELYQRNKEKIENSNNEIISFKDEYYNDRLEVIQRIICADYAEDVNQIICEEGDLKLIRIFSAIRCNLFSWVDVCEENNVLVFGNDIYWCANFLAHQAKRITIVSQNLYQLIIIAEKYPCSNIKLVYANIDDYQGDSLNEKFDYIFASDFVTIGKGDDSFLRLIISLEDHLSRMGKLLYATENPFGVKFWSGCVDSLTNSLWTGIEGYPQNEYKYMTIKTIEEFITQSQYQFGEILYPYPDCWFPMSIYSNNHLPENGELTKNAFSWEKRLHIFNEVNVWNNIVTNEMFKFFSNGFLVVLSNENDTDDGKIFTKFSNDRENCFSIRTDLCQEKNRIAYVEKRGLTCKGSDHIASLVNIEKMLSDEFSDTSIEIQKVICCENGIAKLEYIEGPTLSSVLKECLEKKREEEFIKVFSDFADILIQKANIDFCPSEQFNRVFGSVNVPVGLKCCRVTDIDLIVSNVVIRNDKYGVIDYEWTFSFPIPIGFVIYRSIMYLFKGPRGAANHNPYYRSLLFEKYRIDEDQCEIYSQMEDNFQNYTCFSHIPLRKVLNAETIRNSVIQPEVFLDYGKGFSSKNRYQTGFRTFDKDTYMISIGMSPDVIAIRLDPTNHPCLVTVLGINCVGIENYSPNYQTNGVSIGKGVILYNTYDPQIIIKDIKNGTERIEIEIELAEISSRVSQSIHEYTKK